MSKRKLPPSQRGNRRERPLSIKEIPGALAELELAGFILCVPSIRDDGNRTILLLRRLSDGPVFDVNDPQEVARVERNAKVEPGFVHRRLEEIRMAREDREP